MLFICLFVEWTLVSFRRHRLTHGAWFLCINIFFSISSSSHWLVCNIWNVCKAFLSEWNGQIKCRSFFLCLNSSIWILISRKLDFIYCDDEKNIVSSSSSCLVKKIFHQGTWGEHWEWLSGNCSLFSMFLTSMSEDGFLTPSNNKFAVLWGMLLELFLLRNFWTFKSL